MSEHCGYIVEVKELRPHSNADRLQIATFFGNDTCVDLSVHQGDIGVYFPSDLQLSEEFCKVNDLVRRKDEQGNQAGGYLDPEKRNVKPINLRGERSDGMYLSLKVLEQFTDITQLQVGDTIDVLNGIEICRKYIPRSNHRSGGIKGAPRRQAKKNYAPTFYEHVDTEQLNYHLNAFKAGDTVEITLKMHGTSQRTGYLPLIKTKKRTLWQKLLRKPATEYKEYGYVTGTRRVVLDGKPHNLYYDSTDWREAMTEKFIGKLRKGETVYYEVVGFQGTNGPSIMPQLKNSKIQDKEFTKQYGETTTFGYGCNPAGEYRRVVTFEDYEGNKIYKEPCCEAYVYRMTMVNEDGDVVEYTPDYMRYRCEQMGVKTVPVFEHFIVPDTMILEAGEMVKAIAEQYFDGPDPIGRTHVREGVVCRIVNRPTFEAYKTKNWSFKVLEGIVKDTADAPDIEEAQEETSEA